jgi:hypothetical protein
MELRDFIYVKDDVIPLSALSSLLKWMQIKNLIYLKMLVL